MKFFTKEVQIALVAIVSIVLLFFGLKYLKGLTMFSSDNKFYVVFDNVSGLGASSPVYANGFRVGTVERIDYDYSRPDNIVAVVGLDKQLQLPMGTVAEISSDLLGNVKLELVFGSDTGKLLSVGDTIHGGMQLGAMGKAAAMLPQLEKMLPKLDSILGSVNALLADPALASSLRNVDDITEKLTVTTTELNKMAVALNAQMPDMLKKADGLLANTEGITRQVNEMDLAATMAKVDATLANIQQLTATLNSNKGSIGLLMNDPNLYNQLTATMMEADSLLADIKAHPSRYINVTVFGRKSK